MALILRNGGSQSPDRWLKEPRNNQDLFATLRKYEYNPDLMRLYVVGGGGCLIRNFGTYDKSRVTIIDDICATAKGYESLAYMSLKRRG